MLNNTRKKISKINTHKAVRENIQLNKNSTVLTEQTNNITYDTLVFQIADLNLTHHLNNHKKGLSNKLIVRWWEN